MLDNILILDTETTGLYPPNAKVIEIGIILFSIKYKIPLQNYSTLLHCETNGAIEVNHIDPLWTNCNMGQLIPFVNISDMAKYSQYIVAHNSSFDERFMRTCKELGSDFWEKKWICTKADFRWPVKLARLRLQDVCEGMGVPYIDAHRALSDCNLLMQCFQKVDDLEIRLHEAAKKKFSNAFKFR